MSIDKRGMLDEQPFDYRVYKDGKLEITWNGRPVVMYKGKKSEELIRKLDGADENGVQLILAKATGNFKRGNERISKMKAKY